MQEPTGNVAGDDDRINYIEIEQPLLESNPKPRDIREERKDPVKLVPELCLPTGLTDQIRANFGLMNDLVEHFFQPPGKMEKAINFMQRINDCVTAQAELRGWEMELSKVPLPVLNGGTLKVAKEETIWRLKEIVNMQLERELREKLKEFNFVDITNDELDKFQSKIAPSIQQCIARMDNSIGEYEQRVIVGIIVDIVRSVTYCEAMDGPDHGRIKLTNVSDTTQFGIDLLHTFLVETLKEFDEFSGNVEKENCTLQFTTDYKIAEKPFWANPLMNPQSVAEVVKEFNYYTNLIRREMRKNEWKDLFDGYAEYHYLVYIQETMIGESTIPDTNLENIETLLNTEVEESRPALKIRNLHTAVQVLFPCIFTNNQIVADDFTPELLRGINFLIGFRMFDNPGSYRLHRSKPAQENWEYLNPSQISNSLKHLCAYVRQEMLVPLLDDNEKLQHTVKLAATFMTNFLQIHPFGNGNGRVARLAVSLILKGTSVVPVPVYALEDSRDVFLTCIRQNNYEMNQNRYLSKDLSRLILESATQINRKVCLALDLN